jgi:ribose 5-phosphate isomerase B
MRIAVGSDELTAVTDAVLDDLRRRGHELMLRGPLAGTDDDWPQVASAVGEAVAAGDAEEGILFCWTGTGVSIAANKIPGIRAALCVDAETARGARRWNDANVLCLSLRRTSAAVAQEILEAWLSTQYEPNPSDDACLQALAELERRRLR